MREILPGIYHWKTSDDKRGEAVHSYYIGATSPALLIDPRPPAEGMEWFSARQEPKDILLTNRHHYARAAAFAAAFGAQIWCHEKGLRAFTHGERVKAFAHGDRLPGGVIALAIGGGETGFYLPLHGGVLAIDALPGGRAGLKPGRPVRHLLLAHGAPMIDAEVSAND